MDVKIRMEDGCSELFPTKAHESDAGWDLRAKENYYIRAKQRILIKTGVFIELPLGYEAQVRSRSGLALKHGLTVLNSPGTIDCAYRGEIGVIILNTSPDNFRVVQGDRIAQMIIQKLPEINLIQADTLDETNRGDGGFGSSGVK